MYDQFRFQNLKALGNESSGDGNRSVQTWGNCIKAITTGFWDINGFSELTKLFYFVDSENIILCYRITRSILAHNHRVETKLSVMVLSHDTWFFEKNLGQRNIAMDEGALDAIIAALDLEDSFQNLEDETISDWKIDGVNIEFNIKCDNDTGWAHIDLVYDQFTQWEQM